MRRRYDPECCDSSDRRDRPRRHGIGAAVIGLGLLALGVILTLDNLRVANADDFLPYWPVLLMRVGLSYIVRPSGSRRVGTGLVWLAIGAVVLASNLGVIRFEIWDLWPVILVIVGASLVLKPFRRRRITTGDDANVFDATAILGGAQRRISAENFSGGDAMALLGGCEIDLRDSSNKGGTAEINTFAFWGGIEIRVPDDWEVEVRGTAILGSFEDKTRTIGEGPRKKLVISGTAIMAGVEITN